MARNSGFERTFCATCFEPIKGECQGDCPICGKPLVPLNYSERLRRDNDLSAFVKKTPLIGLIIVAAALAVNMIYGIVSFVICIKGVDMPSVRLFLVPPLWQYGEEISLAIAIVSAIPFVCVPSILMGSHRAVNLFLELSATIGVMFFYNIPGLISVVVGYAILIICEEKIDNRSRTERMKKRFAPKEIYGPTVWECKHCGYINEKRDSECKSCGKYKL